ncbi:MAG: hypothetical protein RIE06_05300 [Roseibium album]|nr:hypothetical protein [Roseibium album]MBG6145798.1 hypothetical protein [Labrenzia sp. EL_142]MBG6154646.1 hypothetical protein [Labrenzia sp. EL_162]MBG6161925.1 hypothetical protein [Labrenzia sp. EL_195]MBG6193224.1 hypothetical protein [Labrenzia sp. EL_159]MBG6209939.1 hypothetical protein [Labrenzia sp. EL_126]
MSRTYALAMQSISKWLPLTLGSMALMAASVQPSDAQSRRPDSRAMTCSQVQSMIERNGAVVLSTGQYTFDRYVYTRNSCQHGEVTRNKWVPTKDVRQCRVRVCIDPMILKFND